MQHAPTAPGATPHNIHAERVNGYDPLPVIDAIRRKRQAIEQGKGPALLDTVTYRISGHSPSDASSYRSKEEMEKWIKADAIQAFRKRLVDSGHFSAADLDAARANVESTVFQMFKTAAEFEHSPRIPITSDLIDRVMFSNRRKEKCDDRPAELNHPLSENPRVQQIRGKIRTPTFDGKPVPKMKAFNVRDALFEAIAHRFSIDPTLVAFGEENRDWGGAFAVYRGLTELLPYHRLFNQGYIQAFYYEAARGVRVPAEQVVEKDGKRHWVIGEDQFLFDSFASCSVMPDGTKARGVGFFDRDVGRIHPPAHDTAQRVKFMDEQGVHAQIIYPNILGFGGQNAAKVDPDDLVHDPTKGLDQILPPQVMWKAHNYNHLHEAPTVFYAVAIVLAIIGQGDGLNAQAAWAYVGLRVIHSIIQATINFS
jgi:hypothetical protein